jgi:anti-anti-sigma factor
MDLLTVSTRAEAGFTIVTLTGELDISTVQEAQQHILAAWAAHGPRLIFDLAALTFTDSTGVSLLLRVYRNAHDQDGSLALTGLSRPVRRVLETAGLTTRLPIFDTVDDAITGQAPELSNHG